MCYYGTDSLTQALIGTPISEFIIYENISLNATFQKCRALSDIIVFADNATAGGYPYYPILIMSSNDTSVILNNPALTIWIEDEYLEAYKSKTNWADYAELMMPLSQYVS